MTIADTATKPKIETFVHAIVIPSPDRAEERSGYSVSEQTLELVNAVIGMSTPLRFPVRSYGGLTRAEEERVSTYQLDVLKEAFRLSEFDQTVGLELAAIAVFRLGYKYKSLTWLAGSPDARKSICAMINKANNARNPHYDGPRA